MAAAVALAELTEKPVPAEVKSAFPADKDFTFGPNYIVPTPFDPRLLKCVAMATAKAACSSGLLIQELLEGRLKTGLLMKLL